MIALIDPSVTGIVALVVSVIGLVLSAYTNKKKAGVDEVILLRAEVASLRFQLQTAQNQIKTLERDKYDLMDELRKKPR